MLTGTMLFRSEIETPAVMNKKSTEPVSMSQIPFKVENLGAGMGEKLSALKAAVKSGRELGYLLDELGDLRKGESTGLLMELLLDLDAVELERLYLALGDLDPSLKTDSVGIALIERLVRLDADRYFKLTDLENGSWNIMPTLGVLFLASVDLEEALKRAQKYEGLEEGIAMGLAVRSTADAVKWLRENGNEESDYDDVFGILLRDPAATLAEVQKIENGEQRNQALMGLCKRWAQKDGRAALGAAEGMKGDARDEAVTGVFEEWVKFEPEAAIMEAIVRGKEMDVLQDWVDVDSKMALAWAIENLDDKGRAYFLTMEHQHLSLDDARSQFLELTEEHRLQMLWHGSFLERLAASDPALVIESVSAMDAGDFGNVGVRLGQALAMENLTGAMAATDSLPTEGMRKLAATGVVMEGGRVNPVATLTWLDGANLPDSLNLEKKIFRSWAERDPESAVEAARLRSEGQGELMSAVVSRWLPHADAEYVFEWVREEMKTDVSIQGKLADVWMERDPEAGVAFLEANNGDGSMDAALEVLRAKMGGR